jgi:hypothetical protein
MTTYVHHATAIDSTVLFMAAIGFMLYLGLLGHLGIVLMLLMFQVLLYICQRKIQQ